MPWRLKRWRSPFLFAAAEPLTGRLVWVVLRSNGINHQLLGTAERIQVEHGPPKWGKSWRWVPRPLSPDANMFLPAHSLRGAAEVLARYAGPFRITEDG